MENIIIADQNKFDSIIQKFKETRLSNLHIVSDFDKTLSKFSFGERKIHSIIGVLREENYLTPDYSDRAKALFEKYHPIEINLNLPLEERKKSMYEWWKTHFELLIECGLSKNDLEKIVNSNIVSLRDKSQEFFNFLTKYNIPLTIISASGLGGDIINMIFNQYGYWNENISVIANNFNFDNTGKVIGIKEPIIHSLNKYDIIIEDPLIFNKIKDRKNIILLGDGVDDIGMVSNLKYDNILKIGYLNEKVEENMENYKKVYDVLILNDGSLEFVNNLLQSLV